jgi:hypothetical protein
MMDVKTARSVIRRLDEKLDRGFRLTGREELRYREAMDAVIGASAYFAPPRARAAVGPCPCECNSPGGFCGGCGHAGCGGRRGR